MDLRDRINFLIDFKEIKPKELEDLTGIDRMKWANLRRNRTRAQQEHIEAIAKLYPEFAYWIISGNSLPESGQISPEIEENRVRLKTGTN